MEHLFLFYQYLWIVVVHFVAYLDFISMYSTILLSLILTMRAFCAFPLLFEGTDKLLILHIGIICTSVHSIISLKTCHLSQTPFSLDSFPHNMFPFHLLWGSLLFVRLPEEKWTPWQISTKFDKFHSTLKKMFQDITFLQGSWNNPTRKEKRFDKYLSSAKAAVRAQLVRHRSIQP